MANCTRCSHFARLDNMPEPEFDSREINPNTGLCYAVCDMEAEVDEIERAEYESLSVEI